MAQDTPTISQSGTESLSGSETINGIVVPPEPSPELNNATLMGVDVNNNGVRDDVERLIAKNSSNLAQFNASMKVSLAYARFLIDRKEVTRVMSLELFGGIICAAQGAPIGSFGVGSTKIRDVTFNTKAREAVLVKINFALDGGFS